MEAINNIMKSLVTLSGKMIVAFATKLWQKLNILLQPDYGIDK